MTGKLAQVVRENIFALLRARGLRQKDLQVVLGVSAGKISLCLSGRRAISLDMLEDVAAVLGVAPEVLLRPDAAVEGPMALENVERILEAEAAAGQLRRAALKIKLPGLQALARDKRTWEMVQPSAAEVSALLRLGDVAGAADLMTVMGFVAWYRNLESVYKRMSENVPEKQVFGHLGSAEKEEAPTE